MKQITVFLWMLLASSLLLYAQTNSGENRINLTTVDGQTECQIIFYAPDIVRILKYPASITNRPEKQSLSVTLQPEATEVLRHEGNNLLTLKSSALTLTINKRDGSIAFTNVRGKRLLRETSSQFTCRQEGADQGSYIVRQGFRLDKEEPIYGLGILQNGKMSQRGEDRVLVQGNVEDAVPFFQSVKGYGLFWDNYSPTRFADKPEETFFESEVGDCIDYYFMVGEQADDVVAAMRRLTGSVPMLPLWTYGFWQSRERYRSQEELLEVVRRHRELGVPLDGIIQDWQYWGNNYLWNAMEFMNSEFNEPQQMVDEVHRQHAHLIISIWSSFGPQTKPYRDLAEKGLLFNFSTWPQSGISEQWPPRMDYPSGVRVYDAYSPVARDIYWKHLTRLYDFGLDGWWMDSTEPDHLDFKPEDMETPTALGSFRRVRNAYPLMSVNGVYDHQRAVSSDKRVFILTRSAFAGQQRTGANTWSGDVNSSWETLRCQIPAGLNFTLTGNPNFNTDIGGFFSGGYNRTYADGSATRNPLFQELYVRWMQFGLFNPMMRSHGTDMKREIYYFGQSGEPVYDAIEQAIRMRYSLLPYIYSTSWQVTSRHSSFMRALVMDFPEDRKGWNCNDQFLFGSSLLVAPVLEAQYTPEKIISTDEMEGWHQSSSAQVSETDPFNLHVDFTAPRRSEVYLPAGTQWYDFWTNARFKGGQTIEKETTLATIPLYVRAGSILPLGPDVQYATEKPWDDLEIRVYPGADGEFTLYEDEFDNYNYEKGVYTTIPFRWDDRTRTLTIGERKGNYPGMLQQRRFRIALVQAGQAAMDMREVAYEGGEVTLKW